MHAIHTHARTHTVTLASSKIFPYCMHLSVYYLTSAFEAEQFVIKVDKMSLHLIHILKDQVSF
jgi:hypothetical protein